MGLLDNMKEALALAKKYNDQDLYEKIVSLREDILELREENLDLKSQLAGLKQEQDISKSLVRDGNEYWIPTDGANRKGPFCMACWDYERKLVNMKTARDGAMYCTVCLGKKRG